MNRVQCEASSPWMSDVCIPLMSLDAHVVSIGFARANIVMVILACQMFAREPRKS